MYLMIRQYENVYYEYDIEISIFFIQIKYIRISLGIFTKKSQKYIILLWPKMTMKIYEIYLDYNGLKLF